MHFGVGRKLKVGGGGGRVRLIKNLDTHKKGHWFRLCITLQKKGRRLSPPPAHPPPLSGSDAYDAKQL